MTLARHRPLIVGIGNPLMGDDGAGIQLIELLTHTDQDIFDLMDCGTDLFRLATLEQPHDTIFIIDAIATGETPGSIHWYRPDHIDSFRQSDSVHQISALEAVFLLPMMNEFISESNFFLVGIESACLSFQPELSVQVQNSVHWLSNEFVHSASLGMLRERCRNRECTPYVDIVNETGVVIK